MFKFKGISSTDMQVVIEEEEHFIAKASKRYEITEIEGRDGAIFDELGYSYVERPIYVQCLNIDKIDDILAWLDGEGEFEYKERKTIARFYSQLDPQRKGYIRIIDTTFIRAPFWIKADDELVTVKDSKVAETEESKSIHIEDASTIPAQLEILGNQEQETRSGKNLLNLRTQSVNGITTTKNTDGTLNIKGTATANGNIGFLNKNIILEANKSYTFSMKKISGQNFNNSVWFWNTTDSNSEITINLNNNTKTVTYDHEVTITAVNMTVNAGNVFDVTLALQVEEGTVATEYEQYGASPSPNYPSKVKCLGNNKNLYNEETIEMNKYLDGDTGVVGASTVSKISDYIELTEKEYTINYTNDINTRGYSFYDADKKFISGKDSNKAPYTITKPDNAKYIRFAVPLDALDVKIEEGTEATSYSPYNQGSTKISKINKNFLKLNDIAETTKNGITYSIQNNTIKLNGTATAGFSIPLTFNEIQLLKNINYTATLTSKNPPASNSSSITLRDGSNTSIFYLECWINPKTVTKEFDDNIFLDNSSGNSNIWINSGTVFNNTEFKIQIEFGENSTDYVEHQQTDYILDIQQEMLEGDYFVKEEDGWKKVHNWDKYIFTGNESFLEASSPAEGTKRFYYENNNLNMYIYNSLYPTQNNFCNYFKSLSWGAIYSSDTTTKNAFICYNNGTAKRMHFRIDSNIASSVNEFKQLLTEKYNAGNPVYVFYKTATPTKLACTEQQSAVLEELNNLDLFSGVNNIITSEDIALLKLSYIQQTNEKIKNEGNIESRPILRLEKTIADSVELTINNCRFKYNFNDEEYVEIDCEEKEVQYEGLNRNRQIEIGYDFPILNVGNNDIKMHSGDCIIKVLRKDRWL